MSTELRNDILKSNMDSSTFLSNCSNNGLCKFSNGKLFCECFPGYIGVKCQTNSRPCSYYPCLNEGTCNESFNVSSLNNQQVWDFTCECPKFFYGKRCESKVNVCENETCNGNGHCFDNSSIPTCKCVLYFSGARCEIQEEKLKTIKTVISYTAIIAIAIIVMLYSSCYIMDIVKLFKPKMVKIKKPAKRHGHQKKIPTKKITYIDYVE